MVREMGTIGDEELRQGPGGTGEKIFVSVRLRPLNEKEIARNDAYDWECINDNTIIFRNNLPVPDRSMYPSAYTFDRVFRCDCSTRQVYEEGAKEVALSVVSGINSSIFAYGQTSSGKTFTMSGITEYAIADIYHYIQTHQERDFLLKFSAMEIYNESVRDLLSMDTTPLRLLDDPERGTIVEKLTEETLRDWSHLRELVTICEAQRQIGETFLNETSSRSHQIIRLTIESSAREFSGNDTSSVLTATVNFVDLAGSERASQSLSAGTRLKEGCHINRSLLTLGTVIRKLSKGRNGHVPYRDSKLTRILQSSLGVNARTAIICTMSPARSHVEQSRNTLLFGSCAKEVSTNAQVNVVMSDKALVKHLQRELARLEIELRTPGYIAPSHSAAILREKDFEIEKLKEEIYELTLQRDLAQSQVKDLMRVIGSNTPTMASSDNHYPKLRVRKSWELETPIVETPDIVNPQSLDTVSITSDTSHNSDKHNQTNPDSDKYYLRIPDFGDNFLADGPPRLSSGTPKVAIDDSYESWEESEEANEILEDLCKEVRCIEVEDSSLSRYAESNRSTLEENTRIKPVEDEEINSVPLKEERELSCIYPDSSARSPEEPSPWLFEKDMSSSRSLKLTRSSSCRPSFNFMTTLSSPSFRSGEKDENTPPIGYFNGRPEGFDRKISTLSYDTKVENLSRKGSETSVGSASLDEVKAQHTKTSSDEDIASIDTFVAQLKEMAKLQYEKQFDDSLKEEIEPTANEPAKNVKDVGLDPMHFTSESPNWPSEFRRIQREIIDLWDACNVSLVHRTYFFLLFKGDPSDSIYMEVELRRLSFLRDAFSQGNKTSEIGQILTPASSMKDLRRERVQLSKKMEAMLSEQERDELFISWGINLQSKQRKLQLAHRLWTETEDMSHINKSAMVMAKLVGFKEPSVAPKEMFGLNFTPQLSTTRSHRWRRSVMSIL